MSNQYVEYTERSLLLHLTESTDLQMAGTHYSIEESNFTIHSSCRLTKTSGNKSQVLYQTLIISNHAISDTTNIGMFSVVAI
jgi:hypothetical protein